MMDLKEMPRALRVSAVYVIYMFSGSLIIGNAYYAFAGDVYCSYGQKILNVIDYVSQDIFKFIIFLIASWIIGFFVSECVSFIPISKSKKLFDNSSKIAQTDFNLAYDTIHSEKYKHRLNEFIVVMMTQLLISSMGSAFFISSLFFLMAFITNLKATDLTLFFLSIFFALICEAKYRRIVQSLDGLLRSILQARKG